MFVWLTPEKHLSLTCTDADIYKANKLQTPIVTKRHFMTVLDRGGGATVGPEELDHFESWTHEFGQEG